MDAKELIRSRFRGIQDQAKALDALPHEGVKGRFRELLVDRLVAPYMPPEVQLFTGSILLIGGEVREARNEDDLVFYDRSLSPLIYDLGTRDAILPVTGVAGLIECKSTLKKADLRDAVRASAEIIEGAFGAAPFSGVFAFKSDFNPFKDGRSRGPDDPVFLPNIVMEYVETVGWKPATQQATCPVSFVCIADKGLWTLTRGSSGEEGWYFVPATDDRHLLAFLSLISNTLYGNFRGIGVWALDPSWLASAVLKQPLVAP